jgi:hypothetical protein
MTTTSGTINWYRVGFSLAYLAAALVCLVGALTWQDSVFYTDLSSSTWHLGRLVWCCFPTFLGFSLIAFENRRNQTSPFPKYLLYYPFHLIMLTVATHGALHCFTATSGFVFYYLSFSVCFFLSYHVDFYWTKLGELLKPG